MAVNESRSMNADLRMGLTDGIVKKDAPDRGGVVERDAHEKATLHEMYDMVAGPGVDAQHAARLASL